MVSIIKVSLILHSPLTPLLSIFPSIRSFPSVHLKDTRYAVTDNSCCHFLENSQFIQCINSVYKSKQATPTARGMRDDKQHLWISQQLLNVMLRFGLCSILPTVFFSLPFLWLPPKEQTLNLPTHTASLVLILNPQIYCRSRPLQTQRTTIRPH